MNDKIRLISEQIDQIYLIARSRYPDLFDNHSIYSASIYRLYNIVYPSIIRELGYY